MRVNTTNRQNIGEDRRTTGVFTLRLVLIHQFGAPQRTEPDGWTEWDQNLQLLLLHVDAVRR